METFIFEKYNVTNNHDLIIKLCQENNFQIAQWLFNIIPDIEISQQDLLTAFISGNLTLIDNLYKLNPSLDIENDIFLMNACKKNVEIVKWILDRRDDVGKELFQNIFQKACKNFNQELAQCIFQIDPSIDVSFDNELAFRSACISGNIDFAKWLLSIKPSINIRKFEEYAFRYSIKNKHWDIAKWLLSLKRKINIQAQSNQAFRLTCEYGNLEFAKFLLNLDNKINISASNHYACTMACQNGHKDVAVWLSQLRPDLYYVRVENSIIREFRIIKDDNICKICEDKIANITTHCNHKFCSDCLNNWYQINKTCPYCRTEIANF